MTGIYYFWKIIIIFLKVQFTKKWKFSLLCCFNLVSTSVSTQKTYIFQKLILYFVLYRIGMTPSGLSKMIRKLSFFAIFFQLYFLILQLKTDLQNRQNDGCQRECATPWICSWAEEVYTAIGWGGAKIMPPFSKGDAHSNRLQNDVMVYFPWEPKFPFKPIFNKHLYFSSSKLWYPPKSLEKTQKIDYLQTILI